MNSEVLAYLPSYSFSAFLKVANTPIPGIKQWWEYKPNYPTTPPINIHSAIPLTTGRERLIPVKIRFEDRPWITDDGLRNKVFMFMVGKSHNGEKLYLHPFTELPETVRKIYPNVMVLQPQNPTNWWWGLLDTWYVNRHAIGREHSKIIEKIKDRERFGEEALKRAEQLLISICKKLGWELYDDKVVGKVKNKRVVIDRVSLSVYVNGEFRCITSNFNTPKDDQVVQKMLALATPSLRRQISTIKDLW